MKLLSTILCITYPLIGFSETYRWVDEQGLIHFGDKSIVKTTKKTEIKSQIKPIPASNADKLSKSNRTAKWKDKNGMLHFGDLQNTKLKNTPNSSPDIMQNIKKQPTTNKDGYYLKAATDTKVSTPSTYNASSATLISDSTTDNINSKSVVKPKKQIGNQINRFPTKKPIKGVNLKSTSGTEPSKWFISIDSKPAKNASHNLYRQQPNPRIRRLSFKSNTNRNAELCGTFTSYVEDYINKISHCERNMCVIYEEYLKKYSIKQQQYCKK